MKAIVVGDDRSLCWQEVATPEPGPGQVRIRVRAAGVNRADLAQRAGRYPPPPGASPILGLECAGEVEALGEGAAGWGVGDRACALLSGGGYAERVVCPAGHLLPVPEGMALTAAAGLMEVLATAWLNLFREARAKPGERALIHAGASGVGTAAIQLCREMGVECWVTVGSREKLRACLELGAAGGICRHEEGFGERVGEWTKGNGFDVILDPVGAAYLEANLGALAMDGRLVLISLLSGSRAEIDLAVVQRRRARIIGSTLRNRSDEAKSRLIADLRERVWPWVAAGNVRPVIHRILPIAAAEEAHRVLQEGSNVGKVILEVGGGF